MPAQRIRVWFRKGDRLRFISHLDVLRAWERAIRRAGLPLAYSQGFTPHPKLAFASPLPLGFVGEAEIVDVTLDERVEVAQFLEALRVESTEDLAAVAAVEVPVSNPSPQATIAVADYRADLACVDPADAVSAVNAFLAAESWPWTEERHDKRRTYDLRSMVRSLRVAAADGGVRLEMRLQADQQATARPEQVVAAIFPGSRVTGYARTGVVLDEPSPARDAWRRRGQYE